MSVECLPGQHKALNSQRPELVCLLSQSLLLGSFYFAFPTRCWVHMHPCRYMQADRVCTHTQDSTVDVVLRSLVHFEMVGMAPGDNRTPGAMFPVNRKHQHHPAVS